MKSANRHNVCRPHSPKKTGYFTRLVAVTEAERAHQCSALAIQSYGIEARQ